jgi:Fe2+ or Zn2+ uptake regulation protein
MNESKATIESIVLALKEKGIKSTPQRIYIYKKVKEMQGHLTAEEIYQKIKDEIPSLSLSTVYRTLRYFEEKGIINSMMASKDYGLTVFDTNISPHHHFICRVCGKIEDIEEKSIKVNFVKNIPGKKEKFSVIIKGICPDCEKKSERKKH